MVTDIDEMAKLSDTLGESIQLREGRRDMIKIALPRFVSVNGGLNKVILETEKNYIEFRDALEEFSMKPEVTNNLSELQYIGIMWTDFIPGFMTIRGLVADIREGRNPDYKVFRKAFIDSEPIYEVFYKVVKRCYGHDFD